MAKTPAFQNLSSIEVHNHPLFYQKLRDPRGGLTDDDTTDWYRWAREAFGDSIDLFCNETAEIAPGYTNREGYFNYVIMLLDHQVDFDGVGLQSHFNRPDAIPTIISTFDNFEALGQKYDHPLKLMVSEYDMTIILDEQLHADFLRDYLTACFAQKSMDRFIMWGFQDLDKLDARRPLLKPLMRNDGSKRAGYYVWRDLVKDVWNTQESLTTDSNGVAECSVQNGEYTVTVNAANEGMEFKVTLPNSDGRIKMILKH